MTTTTYQDEMKALLYNCMGGFSRKTVEIYWEEYQKQALSNSLQNLYIKFA